MHPLRKAGVSSRATSVAANPEKWFLLQGCTVIGTFSETRRNASVFEGGECVSIALDLVKVNPFHFKPSHNTR